MTKKITTTIAPSILALTLFLSSACDDNNQSANEQQYLQKLAFTWNLYNVTLSGANVVPAYPGINLTLTEDRAFTITHPVENVWPTSGTFKLRPVPGSEDYVFVRNDGAELRVVELTETVLRLQMQPLPSSRASAEEGQYEFVFTK
jgi:hypothetical protein